MSKEQTAALLLVNDNCQAVLVVLSNRALYSRVDNSSDLHTVLADFISLLSLLHGATTKVALSLKPSSPTYTAALSPLKEIADHVPALSHVIFLIDQSHGATLLKEIEFVTIDTLESIKSLTQTLLETTKFNTKADTEMYLVRTGAVHSIIEKARAQNGISRDNLAAVRKLWVRDHDSLIDALEEAREICDNVDSLSNESDNGWDELGISTEKLKPAELERATKALIVVRLSTLLHQRVKDNYLPNLPCRSDPLMKINNHIDALASHSSALICSIDELVSALYAPQDVVEIETILGSFHNVINEIKVSLALSFFDMSMEDLLEETSLTRYTKLKKDPKTWFDNCFDQISIAIGVLQGMLV